MSCVPDVKVVGGWMYICDVRECVCACVCDHRKDTQVRIEIKSEKNNFAKCKASLPDQMTNCTCGC